MYSYNNLCTRLTYSTLSIHSLQSKYEITSSRHLWRHFPRHFRFKNGTGNDVTRRKRKWQSWRLLKTVTFAVTSPVSVIKVNNKSHFTLWFYKTFCTQHREQSLVAVSMLRVNGFNKLLPNGTSLKDEHLLQDYYIQINKRTHNGQYLEKTQHCR